MLVLMEFGACFSQLDDKGKLRPISFSSQKFITIQREAYAVVWSIEKFENYVFGTKIKNIKDYNPLTYLQKKLHFNH